MENFLKVISCILLMFLMTVQLLLASPFRDRMVDDSMRGRTIKTYETLIYRGSVTLNAIGEYAPNSATIMVNGESKMTVALFPVVLNIYDGDVIEILLKNGSPSFYVYITDEKGQIKVDSNESSFLVQQGVKKIVKILRNVSNHF